jgi:hypothetical protein
MAVLSISNAWEETKARIASDGRLLAIVAAALIVLPQTVLGLAAQQMVATGSRAILIVFALALLIGLIAQVALIRLSIDPAATVGEAIGRGVKRMPAALGSFVIVLAGLFLFMIVITLLLGAAGLVPAPGAGHSPPAIVIGLLLVLAALIYAVFQLAVPVAAAESGGPIHLLARSWTLARSAYWRLLAFIVLIFIGLVFVLLAGQFGIGSIVVSLLGPADPWSLSALVIELVIALIQASFTVVLAVMLARIYVQLAGARSGT